MSNVPSIAPEAYAATHTHLPLRLGVIRTAAAQPLTVADLDLTRRSNVIIDVLPETEH